MSIAEVLFLILFWSWVAAALLFLQTTYIPHASFHATPESQGLPGETVTFPATDGVKLEGWKIPADSTKPWIIACHGLGTNRADLLEMAKVFHDAGFNLLLFDFRGHGGSAGRFTSFGYTEQRDLEGALAFLGKQPDIAPKRYGIYAISMGASVALMVAGRDERLGAIVVESPYTNLDDSLARHLKLMYPALPRQPFLAYVRLAYRLRFGTWPSQVSPKVGALKMGSRPLLLIAGSEDVRMPAKQIQAMLPPGDKAEFWEINGAGHLQGMAMNPEKYAKRVIQFFSSRL